MQLIVQGTGQAVLDLLIKTIFDCFDPFLKLAWFTKISMQFLSSLDMWHCLTEGIKY